MGTDPLKSVEQAALNKVNQEKSWLVANRKWLIAIAVALVTGFILAKVL